MCQFSDAKIEKKNSPNEVIMFLNDFCTTKVTYYYCNKVKTMVNEVKSSFFFPFLSQI